MATPKKRASNARYLATQKARSIRIKPEEDEQIQAAAAAAGESVQGYILQAVRERMARDAGKTPDETPEA